MPEGEKQLLHLVFGGELTSVEDVTFKDLSKLDIVGVYPNHAAAHAAWKARSQQTVDNAQMRYFMVYLHRLLDPRPACGYRVAIEPATSASVTALLARDAPCH